ncbi:MAG: PrsW family glutamic-type intramembrane protease [Candidatus Methanofastidiosia archaeon]
MIHYVILALAPGIFWMWFFWRKDKYEKEPARYLVMTFFLGALVVIPAAIIETFLISGIFLLDLIIVSLVEEFLKYEAVKQSVFKKSEFNEVMDGIVYAAAAALGFATFENFFYFLQYPDAITVVGRALLSTPGHVLFAAFWGYALGLKKMKGPNILVEGLLLAIAAHTVYNAVLDSPLAVILVIPVMLGLYALFSRRVRKSLDMSPFRGTVDGVSVVMCQKCGKHVQEGVKFCPHCGNLLPESVVGGTCPHCGQIVPPESIFCPHCGKKV